jgi:hypothetical protein
MRAAACRGLAPIAYPCIFRGGSGRAVGTTAIGGKGRNEWCFRAAFCARPSAGEHRALGFGVSLLDPRAWFQLLRLVHYYNCSHVTPRRLADIGPGVRMAPNVSLANGERIKIGAYSHIGARCSIWAGDSVGRITLGRHALLGPEVFITASNYQTEPGTPGWISPGLSAMWSSATTSGLARGLWWSPA